MYTQRRQDEAACSTIIQFLNFCLETAAITVQNILLQRLRRNISNEFVLSLRDNLRNSF